MADLLSDIDLLRWQTNTMRMQLDDLRWRMLASGALTAEVANFIQHSQAQLEMLLRSADELRHSATFIGPRAFSEDNSTEDPAGEGIVGSSRGQSATSESSGKSHAANCSSWQSSGSWSEKGSEP
eukprot:TRINITY_DN69325_c0_g1_i1.p2 TRINITY_DN69325_c0_g1~~TRINITY_DN69325_c0_g1_i1.p2  ORF type:complete len:125 (+),score=20.50 TRINITY_DN69325_c0_g1_i1:61-435(+)